MKQRSLFSILCFVLVSFGVDSVSAQTCSDNGYFRPNGLILWPRRKPFHITENESGTDISAAQSSQYDFKTTKAATNKFSSSNKLSEGGFGEVYKGKLSNGTEVDVKRLSKESGQGIREFKNEAVLVSKLQRMNLVRLLGFCVEGDEKILCVQV